MNNAQLLVRNLESTVKQRLKRRAARHGHSMEEEVREILRNAAREEEQPAGGLGSEIAALFEHCGLEQDVPKLHLTLKPPQFQK